MKLVFMGTPEFAVPSLEKLIDTYSVAAVFTQPDKPKGRGQKLQFSPIKEVALKYNIPVVQPERLKKDIESIELLKKINPDIIVVIAYGQILPKEVLNIPRLGCVNVHASLLPKLRGAAPINWAIINGYDTTGVTTMLMNEGLDTGDMLLKAEIKVMEEESAGELHDRLSVLSVDLLLRTLEGLDSNSITPEKQEDSLSNYAPLMNKDLGHIDWKKDSGDIFNLIRGVTPWPGAYSFMNDKMIKIIKAEKGIKDNINKNPGHIIDASKNGIEVACGKGSIVLKEIQEHGGKRMDVLSYLNGHNISNTDRFE